MRMVREYVTFFTRNRCYMPPSHGIAALVDAYAEIPYDYVSPAARAIDIFFVSDLRGTNRARPREFIELDCQVCTA